MAAFIAEDQTDRRAFLNRMSRLRADTSVSYRVIDVDGAIAGTIGCLPIDNQPEVTYWVDRTQWGKGIASAALQILLAETAERPLYARAASDNVGSLRVLEKAGFRRVASTATSHPVAARRSRKRSCASTEVGTELCVSPWGVCVPARVSSGCGARRPARLAGRTLLRPMRSAPRCGRNEKDHHERKDEPMKLTTTTLVSVDGAAP